MKYRDLTAVWDIDRDKMTRIVGGITWGAHISAGIHFYGEGFANLPPNKALEAQLGLTNLGELIQFGADFVGYPGINGGKAFNNIDVPYVLEINKP
jgi:hypothetical protein